jgi:cell wall-associated NlpC family hydrolase
MLMHSGSYGSSVTKLQRELKAAGVNPGVIDGDFGGHTRAAVMSYQRKHHLAADGVVGNKTWHALMTDGFTPGKPAAHAPVAHHPAPVAPSSGAASSKVQKLLAEARSHLGFHEGYGNKNPFSHALGRPAEAWCADFVSYCAKKAGLHLNTASAQGVANIIKSQGHWKGRNNPQPGDAVTFRWDGSHGWADHVGIVEKTFHKNGRLYVQTIEGNSGDQVRRKVYPVNSSVINGFGRMS